MVEDSECTVCLIAFVEDMMCKTRFLFSRKLQPIWIGMIYMRRNRNTNLITNRNNFKIRSVSGNK